MGGIANMMKAGISVLARPQKVSNTPLHLQIEPTTFCNLKCAFCVREKNVFRPKHMTFETFKEVFDDVKPMRVTFAGDGEPTLCPDLFKMLAYVRDNNARAIVTSNGTLGPELAEQIVDSGLWALRISIDAATAETYRKMRLADFHEAILEGIRAIQALKEERGVSRPDVGFEYVLGRDNLHEMKSVVELAKEMGVCRVNFRPMNLVGIEEREDELLGGLTKDGYRQALVETRELGDSLGIPTNLEEIISLLPFYEERYKDDFNPEGKSPDCIYPWVQIYVAIDGKVTPCCALQMDEKVDFGNLFEDGFDRVWNGEAYKTLREEMKRHRSPYKSCITCEGRSLGKVTELAMKTPGFLKKAK
ncbi:MAG TPA: radical SAM protein [Planctomycetes bacterium]|nr:radical SAM protein [Planctomycetota bacterium]